LTGKALTEEGLELAARISGKTGCKVMGQTYNPRMARGRGRFSIDRIPYVIEQALPILKNFRHIVLSRPMIRWRSSPIRTSRVR
jgi:acetolactate synthase-1/2/3 large subunit